MARSSGKYEWFAPGDLNGFFGLMFDNLTVLSFLAGTLVLVFKFPADIVYTRMFPGTAFGVMVGDLVYTWMAFRLAKRTGNRFVTAMPLGLDTPSTIGMTLVVLGPAFVSLKAEGMSEHDAGMMTWYIGMATMVMIGIFKVGLSFVGQWVQRVVPQAGLLGSLAGIAIALIGLAPLVDIFGMPVIGMLSLGLMLYSLVARIRLPGNVPGVLAAIVLGTVVYYLFGATGWMGGSYSGLPPVDLHFGVPAPTLSFVDGFSRALKYLPISIPFGLLTVVGGINVTESARVVGDDYDTRGILLTEAIATVIAGVCGGVAQSTPYIGHPAYKRMGARAGYTILTALFIGLGGMLGFVSFFVELIPRAVLAPILVFVALDIGAEAFLACPARHAVAVAFAFFPTIARLLAIRLANPDIVPARQSAPAARRARQVAARSARDHCRWKRLHPDRNAVGSVSRGINRSPRCDLVDIRADPGGADVLRRHPLCVAGRRDVPALDAAAVDPENSVSIHARLRAAGSAPAATRDDQRGSRARTRVSAHSRQLMKLTEPLIRSLPKVLLHDHLDGGLRPLTVIELARDQRYQELPTSDPGELAVWFHRGAQRGSLPLYLEGFSAHLRRDADRGGARTGRVRNDGGHARGRRGVCRDALRAGVPHEQGPALGRGRQRGAARTRARQEGLSASSSASSSAPCGT